MINPPETSLLPVSFPSKTAMQQATQNSATSYATSSQQPPAKPASLLDIARNKLCNKLATSSEKDVQQAQKTLLEADAITGDLEAIRKWLTFISEHDPAIINKVLTNCRADADARHYFAGRSGEAS